ncbi:uncharacterized protein EI90DRAFT_3059671, partial [Cantharellus anzutake]|uniref:uncharacterized protein n=1 Tax=Cantharellus anzutake TaxID=1750568 RepID=UPI0019065FC9
MRVRCYAVELMSIQFNMKSICSGCLVLGKLTGEYAVPELGAMSAAHRVSKLLQHQRMQHTDR